MFLLLIVLGLATFCVGNPIIGGVDVGRVNSNKMGIVVHNPGTYPFLVHLDLGEMTRSSSGSFLYSFSTCGGILVTRDLVVTAAHCLNDFIKEPKIEVRAGLVNRQIETQAQSEKSKDYILHEDYISLDGKKYQQNDIALLWMESAFLLTPLVKLAKFPESSTEMEGKEVHAAGWGVADAGHTTYMLKHGKMKVMSRAACKKSQKQAEILPSMICARADSKTVAVCCGDSGGPLVMNDIVVGISSWGEAATKKDSDGKEIRYCNPKKPSVFTRISVYRDWINEQKELGPPMHRSSLDLQAPKRPVGVPCIRKNKKKMCVVL